jgi:hypothetical protein
VPAGSLGGGCSLGFTVLLWCDVIPAGAPGLAAKFDMPSVFENAVEERLGY